MSGTDDHDDDNEKKTADIIAWPGKNRPAPADGVPRDEAEDLVMKALSSITGRDPADLLSELRAREAAEAAEADDTPSNVIDLDAVRAAREAHHDASGVDIGDLARAGFRAVMDELLLLQPQGGELVIDGAFMKAHGPTLIGNVLQQLGKTLLARVAEPDGESPPATDGAKPTPGDGPQPTGTTDPGEADGADGSPDEADAPARHIAEPSRPVEIRFDFGSIAMALLGRLGVFRGTARAEAPPTTEPPTETTPASPDVPPDEPPTEP